MYPAGAHIDAQPFYQCEYVHTRVPFGEDVGRRTHTPAWIEDGANLARAYTMLIEFLRSRLPGYPFAAVPHTSGNSPWTALNVSMMVPWLSEWREWTMQLRSMPPVFPEIAVDNDIQLPAMLALVAAFQDCPAARELATAWEALSDADQSQLTNARTALDLVTYPERAGQTLGEEDFRQLAWAEYYLDGTTSRLDGRARLFSNALKAGDRFLQQVAALFSHLVFYGRVRALGGIELVEQLNGSDAWCSVRSGRYALPPVRLHEVIAFNHPYPRGLMMVEGTTDEWPSDAHTGAMVVRGRLLPDSARLSDILVVHPATMPR